MLWLESNRAMTIPATLRYTGLALLLPGRNESNGTSWPPSRTNRAHRQRTPKNIVVVNAFEGWLPCDKSGRQPLSLFPPGTGFLDAETRSPKPPPETTYACYCQVNGLLVRQA